MSKIYSRSCDYCGKFYAGCGKYFCSNTCRHNADTQNLETRFWSKVEIKDFFDCWNWTANKTPQGYGRFQLKRKKSVSAHRLAWELTYGKIPNGLHVLHKCNNPSCVNPSHLKLGTNQDNVDDKLRANRQPHICGQNVATSKLTESQVREIFALLAEHRSYKEIAERFSISTHSVSNFNIGISWKHLKRPIPIIRYVSTKYKLES